VSEEQVSEKDASEKEVNDDDVRPAPPEDPFDSPLMQAAWRGVSAAFASLGRVFVCLDRDFHVVHASASLERFLGPGADRAAVGRPIAALLGADLFGEAGILRRALAEGEVREGWRGVLRLEPFESRVVSVTAAPFRQHDTEVCDPRVAYLVVMRPADEDPALAPEGGPEFAGLIAASPGMARVFALVNSLEHSEATILLTGESGTGKEVVARMIHARSPRREGQFVVVNCGALPGELLESELFGHVRGAFTGAVRDRVGRFELAHRGTLFLDEVGDLPLHLQVKLLRVLQERTFERVGENRTRTTDARIIAATNVDLRKAVAEGRFREDLYYRLRVVPIEIPPLRERREDIEPLARALLDRVARRERRAVRLSPNALRMLQAYSWPGNVRELENAIEYAVAVARGQTLLPEDFPPEIRASAGPDAGPRASATDTPGTGAAPPGAATQTGTPPDDPRGLERERIRRALEAARWRRQEAARRLGISRTTLWRKMRELGLDT